MSDDADAAREYERLRGELADYVLGILSERMASGKEPQLSQALTDAIDRRVDAAIAERTGRLTPADAERVSATRRTTPVRRATAEPVNRGRLIALALAGAAALAAIVFVVIRFLPAGTTSTTTRPAPVANEATIIQLENGQVPPSANQAQGNDVFSPLRPDPQPQPQPAQAPQN